MPKIKAKESFVINWDTITTEQINVYKVKVHSNCIFQAPTSVLNLKEYNENIYKNDIDVYFKQIISCLIKCSEDIVTKTNSNKRNFKPIPGWDNYVAEYHANARESYKKWCNDGSPKYGPS